MTPQQEIKAGMIRQSCGIQDSGERRLFKTGAVRDMAAFNVLGAIQMEETHPEMMDVEARILKEEP